jgi:uncharacterized lipoprotein YddW (UPF0748 family)
MWVSPSFAEKRELRLLLDEEFSWMDRAAADQLVSKAKRAGFNAIVPCVWHGRGVTWRSSLPREPRWSENPRGLIDPLAYLIKKAHAEGIEVHPWFTLVKRQRDFYPEYAGHGVPEDAFDVHDRQFQRMIRDVVIEVVEKYPVDGINLDYVRSRGICVSDKCIADYRAKTGRNLAVDSLSYKLLPEAKTAIENWNRSAVEELLRSISKVVRDKAPNAVVSVSSHAGYEPLRLEGTDSIAWANSGLVDYILHIEYAQLAGIRRDLLEKALIKLNDPSRLIMIAGNYEAEKGNRSHVWPRDPVEVGKVIRFATTFNPAQRSAALYEYRFLTEAQIPAVVAGWGAPESATGNAEQH